MGHNAAAQYGGNWMNNTGYACMELLMIEQFRANWSLVNNGDILPFGLVTLASGTSEGHQLDMGNFRWNQMLNYDILPPPSDQVPKTFVVQGHDIGDPWYGVHCCMTIFVYICICLYLFDLYFKIKVFWMWTMPKCISSIYSE